MKQHGLSVITHLARVPSAEIQHMKEEAKLTGQTELLLAQVILHQAPDRLQEIQHLTTKERKINH